MNVKAGLQLVHQSSCLATKGRYIMQRTDFGRSQFTDDEDRDGPRNVAILAIQPPDAAVNLRRVY